MAIVFIFPVVFFIIIWERKKMILNCFVLDKQIQMKKRYLLLMGISYGVGIFSYFSFVNLIAKEHIYKSMHLLVFTPLYIAICAFLLLFFEFVLGILVVFIEHVIIDQLICKYYKLNPQEIQKYYTESSNNHFKFYFYANCIGTLYAIVISILILIGLKYLFKV